jgi:hypothetical protein
LPAGVEQPEIFALLRLIDDAKLSAGGARAVAWGTFSKCRN